MRSRSTWSSIGFYAVHVIIATVFLVPFFWTISTSFKLPADIFAYPLKLIPKSWTLLNYSTLLGDKVFIRQFLNSAVVSVSTVIGIIGVSSLAGYALAKISFPGKSIFFILFLTPLMIPFQVILMPLFILIKNMGLINTYTALVIIYITFQIPLATFMMRNTFAMIPSEIQEAALLDGCSTLGVFTRIMLPLSWVGIVTVSIFAFMFSWNEYLIALIFTTSKTMRTLPVGLFIRQSTFYGGGVYWEILSTGSLISCVPIIMVFLILQRYFIKGITGGAIK